MSEWLGAREPGERVNGWVQENGIDLHDELTGAPTVEVILSNLIKDKIMI